MMMMTIKRINEERKGKEKLIFLLLLVYSMLFFAVCIMSVGILSDTRLVHTRASPVVAQCCLITFSRRDKSLAEFLSLWVFSPFTQPRNIGYVWIRHYTQKQSHAQFQVL